MLLTDHYSLFAARPCHTTYDLLLTVRRETVSYYLRLTTYCLPFAERPCHTTYDLLLTTYHSQRDRVFDAVHGSEGLHILTVRLLRHTSHTRDLCCPQHAVPCRP